MTFITITAKDGGQFKAYKATPAGGKGPGLVLIQEIFGVNKVMRDQADALAQQGYIVFCPDLFWRQEPGVDITDQSEAEWAKAFSLYKGFNEAVGIDDLKNTLDTLREQPGFSGRAGCVGYCLGGKLAYLMATRSTMDCSVSFYGVGIEGALPEARAITKPLLMHIAEKDEFSTPEAQKKIKDALGGNAFVTIHSYPGQNHAFAREGGKHYNKAAADLANQRTAEFFQKYLRR